MKIGTACLTLIALFLLNACARPISVVEDRGFQLMAKRMTKEMQARNILDGSGRYLDTPLLGEQHDYGKRLFECLSPSFMLNDAGHVYLGESLAATVSSKSRVRHHANGFSINHPTQILTVNMLAVADWDNDGTKEWIVSCLVEPKRGGRTRTYYLLVPPLDGTAKNPVQATVAAVWECFGLACNLYVRNSKHLEPAASDPAQEPTLVQDIIPGLQTVTEPPKKVQKGTGRLGERDIQ